MSRYFSGYKGLNTGTSIQSNNETDDWKQNLTKRNFFVAFFLYIFNKLKDLANFLIYSIIAFADLLSDIKFLLVQNMFWGRSKFYKIGTQLLVGILTLIVGFANIANEIAKVNATPSQFSSDYNAVDDMVTAGGSLNDISGTLSPIPATIPSVKIRIEAGDNLDSMTRKFVLKDQEFALSFGETLSITEEVLNRKKSVIKLLNNLKGTNPVLLEGDELVAYNFDGIVHEVKSGDTLESVAKVYEKTTEEIKLLNSYWLADPFTLKEGDKLVLTGVLVKEPEPPKPIIRPSAPREIYQAVQPSYNVEGQYARPLEPGCGAVTQWFWAGHNGVDIAQNGGCKILAVADGVVEYAGWKAAGYGYMVRINHGNGLVSEYAHGAGTFYVTAGQSVSKGQPIMYMGSTGNSTGTHLHVMIIVNGINQNPANYISF